VNNAVIQKIWSVRKPVGEEREGRYPNAEKSDLKIKRATMKVRAVNLV
jgi:hypothetical protein